MRLPQLSTQVVLGGGLFLLAALGGGLAVVLTDSPAKPSSLQQETPRESPTPEGSFTPSETPSPTASPTPSATASPTASPTASSTPSPTHAVVATPTRSPRPTPSPTCGTDPCPGVPEGVSVTVEGPLTVVVGRSYDYVLHVSWTKERPKVAEIDFDQVSLGATNGCDRPKRAPAGSGPGSVTIRASHTWQSTNGRHAVIGIAYTACQYYEGADDDRRPVTVSPAPSPQPS